MFSRDFIRALTSLCLPRRPLWRVRPFLSATAKQPRPSTQRRLQSQFPRPPAGQSPRLRFNLGEARAAKPLVTTEQLKDGFRSPISKWGMVLISGSAVLFYAYHIEEVPVSGRKRFNCYSEKSVEEEGLVLYKRIMEEQGKAILPPSDPRARMVNRVMDRLVPANGLEHVKWEVHVIHSDETNAFVIPGGKVFVYSGMLGVAQTDSGLAAILGHEIAHNVAKHSAEAMSAYVILAPIRYMLLALDMSGFTFGLGRVAGGFALELGIARPASRQQEREADFIGLMMMARACYDPAAAVGVWQRMEAADARAPPEWLSTHPSHAHRIENMRLWLDQATQIGRESDCASTAAASRHFTAALTGLGMARGGPSGFFGM